MKSKIKTMNQKYNNIITTLLPYHAQLIAVSKTKPEAQLMEYYNIGHRVFGENYVQELVDKAANLPKDIEWNMIGHLQSNKVKYIAPFVAMIHTVDSLSLLQEINKQALKNDRKINVLLQFKINDETTKFGLELEESIQILDNEAFKKLENINICGVMGMATFTDNKTQVRREFKALKQIFETLKLTYFSEKNDFKHISMGMSDDYPIALEEGSTMIRVGSLLFGGR
jgi:pyridoxal phosphate enzyme (YggS family)